MRPFHPASGRVWAPSSQQLLAVPLEGIGLPRTRRKSRPLTLVRMSVSINRTKQAALWLDHLCWRIWGWRPLAAQAHCVSGFQPPPPSTSPSSVSALSFMQRGENNNLGRELGPLRQPDVIDTDLSIVDRFPSAVSAVSCAKPTLPMDRRCSWAAPASPCSIISALAWGRIASISGL